MAEAVTFGTLAGYFGPLTKDTFLEKQMGQSEKSQQSFQGLEPVGFSRSSSPETLGSRGVCM